MLVEVCMRATGTGKKGTITHGVCVSAAYFDSILSGREADPKIEALSRNSKNVLQKVFQTNRFTYQDRLP